MKEKRGFSQIGKIALYTLCTVALLAFTFFITFVFSPLRNGVEQFIIEELDYRGYDTSNLTVAKTDKQNSRPVYTSSRAVDIGDGTLCSQWVVYTYGTYGCFVSLLPYPYNEWPKPVNIVVTLSPDEYNRVTEKAQDEDISEYIKTLILDI